MIDAFEHKRKALSDEDRRTDNRYERRFVDVKSATQLDERSQAAHPDRRPRRIYSTFRGAYS